MFPLFSTIGHPSPRSGLILENFGFAAPVHGLSTTESTHHGLPVHASLTPDGSYHSIISGTVWQEDTAARVRCLRVLSDILTEYVGRAGICLRNCRVLICGLGNGEVTPDALGYGVCRRIPVIPGGLRAEREIYVFCPGVPARTGIASDILVHAVAERMHPDLLITVDALCARSLQRLASVIQVTDVGVIPGSGGTAPESGEISSRTMPCPVITVGVPTVISSDVMFRDALGGENFAPDGPAVTVSHSSVDRIVEGYSEIIAGAINRTLFSQITG